MKTTIFTTGHKATIQTQEQHQQPSVLPLGQKDNPQDWELMCSQLLPLILEVEAYIMHADFFGTDVITLTGLSQIISKAKRPKLHQKQSARYNTK